jgi:hypothetical protein
MQSILERLERKRNSVINSKADRSFAVITNKKKTPRSPPIMNLRSALHDNKTHADNPKLRLSIEDYRLMCKNKILKNMMAKVLNTDVVSLTAICKNMEVVNNYVDLSHNTKQEKTKAKTSPMKDVLPVLPHEMKTKALTIMNLPDHIIENITHNSLKSLYKSKYKLEKYKLVDGIPAHSLLDFPKLLFKNKNALYFLMENNINIDYYWMSSNTNPVAIELLKEEIKVNPDARIKWIELSRNPKAIKILKANRDKIVWPYLCFNTNPEAMKLIEEEIKINPEHINFENLANNETPEAMKLIEDNLFIKNSIYNTNSIYSREWNRFWQALSRNSKAIKILKANSEKIDWCELCGNQSTEAIKLLEEKMMTEPDIINWNILSGNPNQRAFAILEANPTKINWPRLSNNSNPKAIEILEKRMEFESKFSDYAYENLSTSDKINWNEVSKNPNAIKLLKKRIIYENDIPRNRYMRLKWQEKIDWNEVSINPSIFTL